MTTAADKTEKPETIFTFTFMHKIVVSSPGGQESATATAKKMHEAIPFLKQHTLSVAPATAEEKANYDGRTYIDENEILQRKPIDVESMAALRVMEAEAGENVRLLSDNGRTYVYRPDLGMAPGADLSHVVTSQKAGIWIELEYMKRMMSGQMQGAQAQAQAMQAAQKAQGDAMARRAAAGPSGLNGQRRR